MTEFLDGFKEGIKFIGWISGALTVTACAALIISGVSELIVAIVKAVKKVSKEDVQEALREAIRWIENLCEYYPSEEEMEKWKKAAGMKR